MDPITVKWNGPTTVQEAVETPDETMDAGEYLDALVEAHQIPGVDHELGFADGETIPDDTKLELLSGLTVFVRAFAAPAEGDGAPKAAPRKARAAKKR